MIKRVAGSILVIVLTASTQLMAQDDNVLSKMTPQQRLERLERILSSDALTEQLHTVQSLREEIAILREQIELQDYELENIKQRQRSLYLDMDRRISNVETGSSRSSTGAVPVPPPTTGPRPVPRSSSTSNIPRPVSGDKDGKKAYDMAFALLKEGRYQPAIESFEAFIKTYPESKYADNAQYWLGEANYVSRNYKKSLEEFQRLIAQFPDSTKIPGARLKIGYVYYELKNWSAAREALQLVVKSYPDSTVAKKASERMERIEREGH